MESVECSKLYSTGNSIIKEDVLDIAKDIVTGTCEYASPEGKPIKVSYTAGAGFGFNPRTTEDVIPAAIIDAIELNLSNPPKIKNQAAAYVPSANKQQNNIMVTYTRGGGIGFNPRSTEDVIPAAIIDSIELNLRCPPETS